MARQLEYPKVVGLRLTVHAQQKLARLCRQTHRPRADLMRLLIDRAELVLGAAPDAALVGEMGKPQANEG
jgi:hypothetical protein